MAAITNSSNKPSEFSGEYKIWSFYDLALASASETLTLTFAANSITSIQNVIACMNGGQDDGFLECAVSFSGLVVTITGCIQEGTAADEFTGTTANLLIVGK